MSNITLPPEVISEFTLHPDGCTTTTIRGAARLAGVNEKALRYQFSRAEKSTTKLAQRLIELGFNPAEFSSGIPEIPLATILEYYSFDAGARCTEQARLIYKALASIGIRAWLQQQLNYQPTQSKPESTRHDPNTPTIEDINAVFAGIYKLNIQLELIESAKLTAIAKTFPNLSSAAEEGKQLLSTKMIVDEMPMSPTKLGKIISQRLDLEKPISARRINESLVQAQLQIAERVTSRGKERIQYRLTTQGEQFGRMQMDTAKGHNKTVYIVRWFESVIRLIIDDFKN
ncbi:MAG: hypothetical protein AAGF26_01580 [Cyanobacteria bacterium P01_G01_bin.49]